jgi:uncharacterized membrane protein
MIEVMNRRNVAIHLTAIGALTCATVFIDIARNIPRVLPAFDQRFFSVLLSLLILTLPVSAWQCRHRVKDLKVVLGAYGAAAGVLMIEAVFAMSVFRAGLIRVVLPLLFIGAAYAVLQVCIVRLAGKHLWLAATTFLLFAGTGIADLYSANSYHGNIHWIVTWTV